MFVNSAWIEEHNIKPYQEHKEQLIKSCKTAAFKDAVAQIEEYIKNPEVSLTKHYLLLFFYTSNSRSSYITIKKKKKMQRKKVLSMNWQ